MVSQKIVKKNKTIENVIRLPNEKFNTLFNELPTIRISIEKLRQLFILQIRIFHRTFYNTLRFSVKIRNRINTGIYGDQIFPLMILAIY